jgi:hypothetical protein
MSPEDSSKVKVFEKRRLGHLQSLDGSTTIVDMMADTVWTSLLLQGGRCLRI